MSDLAKRMKDFDFCLLYTHAVGGEIAGRPMSNNRDVDYEGDSYFFALDSARSIGEIEKDAKVSLAFQGNKGLLGKPPLMISVEGVAELSRDKATLEKHWTPSLERWFEKGVDTPGIVLIHVHASRIHYWDGEDEGELRV